MLAMIRRQVAALMLMAPAVASGQPESAQAFLEWPSGACYLGEIRECKRHGQGIMVTRDGSCYVGGFRDGQPHGAGTVITRQGLRFSGQRIGHVLAFAGITLWPVRPEWVEPEPEPLCDCAKLKAAARGFCRR